MGICVLEDRMEAHMTSPKIQIKELIEKIEAVLFSDYEEAKRMLDHLLDLSSQENDPFGLYKANNMLGILSSDIGKMDEALNYYSIAMSYTVFDDVKEEKPVLLNNIGTALVICGNHLEAIEYLTNALKIIYETGIRKDLIFTLKLNIADAYLHIDEPSEAIKVIEEAKVNLDPENLEDKAVMLGTLANATLLLKDYNRAYGYILNCEEAAQQSNYTVLMILVDYYKAKYFELTDAYEDAERFYNKALLCQFEGESYYHFNQIALDYIVFLKSQKEYSKAVPLINRSIELAKNKGWDWVLSDYYKALSECYSALNKWQEAALAFEDYFEMENANKVKRNLQSYNIFKVQEQVLTMNIKNRSLSDSVERLKVVNNILKQVNASKDLMKLIDVLYGSLKSIFKIDTFALGIYDEVERVIKYVTKFENGESLGTSNIDFDNVKSFSAYVRRNNSPVIINDMDDFEFLTAQYPNVKLNKEDIVNVGNHSKSIVIWPMQIDDRMIGLVNCQALEKNTFSPFDIELIEMLSAHLAIAIENYYQKNELKEAIMRLNRLSFIDSLTQVYNRQALNEYLPKLYAKAIEEKNHIVFAMIDLDNFKNLNDQYGHQEGDLCLQAFAGLLKNTLGELGYIYRYGGDEFSLLFVGIDLEVVEAILYEIIERSNTFYQTSNLLKLTASIGAVFVENGDCHELPINSFINYADNALYIAKNEGKNKIRKVVL